MILNTCNFIKRIEQVLAELDISAIEVDVIIIINNYVISVMNGMKGKYDNLYTSICYSCLLCVRPVSKVRAKLCMQLPCV